MYTELKSKFVKCRKDHQCEWCGEPIGRGSRAHYRAYVWEDGFQTGYMHPECHEGMLASDSSLLEDGWATGDMQRGRTAQFSLYGEDD